MPIDPTIFLRGYQGPVDTQQIFDRAQMMRDARRRASINDQLGQQQIQEGQLRLNQIGKQIQDQEAMKQAAMGAVKPVTPQYSAGPSLLQPTVAGPTTQQFDPSAYQSNLSNAGFPLEAAQFQQQQDAHNLALQKSQADLEHTKAQTIEQLSMVPVHEAERVAKSLDNAGKVLVPMLSVPDEQYQQIWQSQVLPQLAQISGWGPQQMQQHAQAPPKDQLQAQIAGTQAGVEYLKNKQAQANSDREFGLQTQKFNEEKRHNQQIEANANVSVPLSDEALNQAADMYATTGQLPAMGMGKAGANARAKVMERSAERHPSNDIASNKAEFGAQSDALKKIVGMKNAVEAYESTAGKNLDLFIQTAKEVPDTGLPILNSPYRTLAEKMGSQKVAAYNAARQVALTEIARVVNNPNLTGVLSDSARAEIESFNPKSATLGQTLKVAQTLRQDMKNRHDSLVDQESTLRGNIRKQGGTQQSGGNDPFAQFGGKAIPQ